MVSTKLAREKLTLTPTILIDGNFVFLFSGGLIRLAFLLNKVVEFIIVLRKERKKGLARRPDEASGVSFLP